jgi:hypothetical protein
MTRGVLVDGITGSCTQRRALEDDAQGRVARPRRRYSGPEMMFEMAARNGVRLRYGSAGKVRDACYFADLQSFLASGERLGDPRRERNASKAPTHLGEAIAKYSPVRIIAGGEKRNLIE